MLLTHFDKMKKQVGSKGVSDMAAAGVLSLYL